MRGPPAGFAILKPAGGRGAKVPDLMDESIACPIDADLARTWNGLWLLSYDHKAGSRTFSGSR